MFIDWDWRDTGDGYRERWAMARNARGRWQLGLWTERPSGTLSFTFLDETHV